jgi:hypothetical protein
MQRPVPVQKEQERQGQGEELGLDVKKKQVLWQANWRTGMHCTVLHCSSATVELKWRTWQLYWQ